MANLIQDIEAQIAGAKATAVKQNIGVIREIGDGVAKVEGLGDVMLNEMLDFGNGITGLALSLQETEVGVIVLGEMRASRRATRFVPRANCCRSRSARDCSVASSTSGTDRRQGPIASDVAYPGRENRPHHAAQTGQPAGADRHHGNRRDDPDRPRSARADHRRPIHRQDDDLRGHHHQPGSSEQAS